MSGSGLGAIFNKLNLAMGGGAAPTPAAPPTSTAQGPAQGSNVPAFQTSTTEAPKPTPMGDFAGLFNPTEVKEGELPPTIDDPYITLDNAKIHEVASRMSFTQNPELADLAAKALTGDVQSFMGVLDLVARNAYAQSTSAAAVIADKTAREGVTRLDGGLQKRIQSLNSSNALTKSNPLFSNPAITPVMQSIKTQVETQNPTFTPDQVKETVVRYFNDMQAAFAAQNTPAVANNGLPAHVQTDFSNW